MPRAHMAAAHHSMRMQAWEQEPITFTMMSCPPGAIAASESAQDREEGGSTEAEHDTEVRKGPGWGGALSWLLVLPETHEGPSPCTCRRNRLMEASKNWVASPEELQARINAALDNPKPFGFITNLPKTTV
jgi:hypothetical protein